MNQYTSHSIKLQDGTLLNLKRRVKKHETTLLFELTTVKDGRSSQGKRHPLENILLMLFCAVLAGCSTITACHCWTIHNRWWLKRIIDMPHGIPDPTTISYALQVCDMGSLVFAWNTFRGTVYGCKKDLSAGRQDTIASMDGKTMRGVHGINVIRHILSLFTHETHQTIGQIGVSSKENEIPAALRLFEQTAIAGLMIIADALHTQKNTITTICAHHADYLLMVKENQRELLEVIRMAFTDPHLKGDTKQAGQYTRGRSMETVVDCLHDPDVCSYLGTLGWQDVACVGRVHRFGTRSIHGVLTAIDETVYFISSKVRLSAWQACTAIRSHWKIENNLHWQKDHTYDEDHQTVRLGSAPQVMSFLRSMGIGLMKLLDLVSVTQAVTNFRMNASLHHQFLAYAGVV